MEQERAPPIGGPPLPGPSPARKGGSACRKRTKAGVYTADITYEDLQAKFTMPSQKAAESLGVGLTIFKRICRRFGLKKWPYRQLLKQQREDRRRRGGGGGSRQAHHDYSCSSETTEDEEEDEEAGSGSDSEGAAPKAGRKSSSKRQKTERPPSATTTSAAAAAAASGPASQGWQGQGMPSQAAWQQAQQQVQQAQQQQAQQVQQHSRPAAVTTGWQGSGFARFQQPPATLGSGSASQQAQQAQQPWQPPAGGAHAGAHGMKAEAAGGAAGLHAGALGGGQGTPSATFASLWEALQRETKPPHPHASAEQQAVQQALLEARREQLLRQYTNARTASPAGLPPIGGAAGGLEHPTPVVRPKPVMPAVSAASGGGLQQSNSTNDLLIPLGPLGGGASGSEFLPSGLLDRILPGYSASLGIMSPSAGGMGQPSWQLGPSAGQQGSQRGSGAHGASPFPASSTEAAAAAAVAAAEAAAAGGGAAGLLHPSLTARLGSDNSRGVQRFPSDNSRRMVHRLGSDGSRGAAMLRLGSDNSRQAGAGSALGPSTASLLMSAAAAGLSLPSPVMPASGGGGSGGSGSDAVPVSSGSWWALDSPVATLLGSPSADVQQRQLEEQSQALSQLIGSLKAEISSIEQQQQRLVQQQLAAKRERERQRAMQAQLAALQAEEERRAAVAAQAAQLRRLQEEQQRLVAQQQQAAAAAATDLPRSESLALVQLIGGLQKEIHRIEAQLQPLAQQAAAAKAAAGPPGGRDGPTPPAGGDPGLASPQVSLLSGLGLPTASSLVLQQLLSDLQKTGAGGKGSQPSPRPSPKPAADPKLLASVKPEPAPPAQAGAAAEPEPSKSAQPSSKSESPQLPAPGSAPCAAQQEPPAGPRGTPEGGADSGGQDAGMEETGGGGGGGAAIGAQPTGPASSVPDEGSLQPPSRPASEPPSQAAKDPQQQQQQQQQLESANEDVTWHAGPDGGEPPGPSTDWRELMQQQLLKRIRPAALPAALRLPVAAGGAAGEAALAAGALLDEAGGLERGAHSPMEEDEEGEEAGALGLLQGLPDDADPNSAAAAFLARMSAVHSLQQRLAQRHQQRRQRALQLAQARIGQLQQQLLADRQLAAARLAAQHSVQGQGQQGGDAGGPPAAEEGVQLQPGGPIARATPSPVPHSPSPIPLREGSAGLGPLLAAGSRDRSTSAGPGFELSLALPSGALPTSSLPSASGLRSASPQQQQQQSAAPAAAEPASESEEKEARQGLDRLAV